MSIKVLYLSNHRNLSGWSSQACNTILSLDTIPNVEVVPRHINILNNINPDLPERIKELEQCSDRNPDVIIQNVLPSMLEYTSRVKKNICYFVCESNNFKATGWQYKLNLMDNIFVPCFYNKQAALASNVTKPVHIVPECTNLEKYNKIYPTHRIRETYPNDFIFYTISEWTTRKNLECLIKAFHLEFEPTEPVQLFIKTNPGININQKLEEIKKDLRLYKNIDRYKRENIQAEFVLENEINSIHKSCDCYISTANSEAWSIPLIDGLGFGKIVVAPRYGGPLEYLNDNNSILIDGIEDCIQKAPDAGLPDIYLSSEQWFHPSLKSTRRSMRIAFEKRDLCKKKIEKGKETVKKYSFESIGKIAQGYLFDK